MPEGVVVDVGWDGFATIDFVDPKLRGPGLKRLLAVGGPETISTDTRSGPRRKYRVPEGNAREAGLLDDPAPPAQASVTPGSGEPSLDWTRQQLDDAARQAGVNPAALPNKPAVLEAIEKIRKRS